MEKIFHHMEKMEKCTPPSDDVSSREDSNGSDFGETIPTWRKYPRGKCTPPSDDVSSRGKYGVSDFTIRSSSLLGQIILTGKILNIHSQDMCRFSPHHLSMGNMDFRGSRYPSLTSMMNMEFSLHGFLCWGTSDVNSMRWTWNINWVNFSTVDHGIQFLTSLFAPHFYGWCMCINSWLDKVEMHGVQRNASALAKDL